MRLDNLYDILVDAEDELESRSFPVCDICIDLGYDNFKYVDKVQLRFNNDNSHAILVFGCRG